MQKYDSKNCQFLLINLQKSILTFRFQEWSKHWFVLWGSSLYYYQNIEAEEVRPALKKKR